MKKLGVMILTGCVMAAIAAGPAYATPAPAPGEAQELCRSTFAAEACADLAAEWAAALEARDAASIEAFADQLVAWGPDSDTVCRAIFSDQVCDILESDPPPLPTIDDIRYIVLWLADCVVHQTCIAIDPGAQRGSADARVCREVFADGICDRIEDPVGTVVWLYDSVIRCYLDPECFPTSNLFCNQYYCLR